MDVKVGDVVHVRGTVLSLDPCKDGFPEEQYATVKFFEDDSGNLEIRYTDIVYVEPRPLAVGDEVRVSGYNSGCGAIILAIDGDEAWLKWKHNTSRFIAKLIQLTRVNLVP